MARAQAAALIEVFPGACDHHRYGDGLGPVSRSASDGAKAKKKAKRQQNKRETAGKEDSPVEIPTKPDGGPKPKQDGTKAKKKVNRQQKKRETAGKEDSPVKIPTKPDGGAGGKSDDVTLAQYEAIAATANDADLLVRFQEAVAREGRSRLGLNANSAAQSKHVTALQLFHLSLLKSSRAPPWKTAKAKKNVGVNKLVLHNRTLHAC